MVFHSQTETGRTQALNPLVSPTTYVYSSKSNHSHCIPSTSLSRNLIPAITWTIIEICGFHADRLTPQLRVISTFHGNPQPDLALLRRAGTTSAGGGGGSCNAASACKSDQNIRCYVFVLIVD